MNRSLILASLLVSLAACAPSTQFDSEWYDPQREVQAINKVLVIGISDTVSSRRQMETLMARALKAQGVEADAAFRIMQGTARPDRETLQKTFVDGGYDSAIVTHLKGAERSETYHPASVNAIPAYYHGLYGYYSYVFNYVHSAGYYTQQEDVYLETSLYDATSGEPRWLVHSTSTDPKSASQLIEDVADGVIARLKIAGFIR